MSVLCFSIPLHGERVPVNLEKSNTEVGFLFELEDALFEKIEDTLQIYFPHNNSTLVLENFYKIYDENSYPSFTFISKRVHAHAIISRSVGSYIEYGKSYYEIDELPAPNDVYSSNIDYKNILAQHHLDLSAFSGSRYIKTLRLGDDAIIQVGESKESCHEFTLKNLGEYAGTIEKELQNHSCKTVITL